MHQPYSASYRESFPATVKKYVEANGCDLILFNGEIRPALAFKFLQTLFNRRINSKHDALHLLLITYGGDIASAYRIARSMRRHYKKIRILVPSQCKSAGTLVALAADELRLGDLGELGPLDS